MKNYQNIANSRSWQTENPVKIFGFANAYDACATEVYIRLYDADKKKVVVEDNGVGMSFEQVNDYFLKIGRNRRAENQQSQCGRIPTGKKGLGKLALFGIGDTINITTYQEKEGVGFNLDWNEILNTKGTYEPKFERSANDENRKGTTITLTNLKRKTGFPVNDYAESIAKLFNFQDEFIVYLSLNDGEAIKIDNKLKYQNITSEFEWNIQDIIKVNDKDYSEKTNIQGTVVTTEKPLKANLRGITLFANGRMVNYPEFFSPSESSHFYSYTTGWLNVDFIDNWEEDVISTNRQSIDWENPKTSELREYLASCLAIIERQWRDKRKNKKKEKISKTVNLDVKSWLDKLPTENNVQTNVESIVNLLDDTPELSESTQQKVTQSLHQLVPEYPFLHWRHLNDDIKSAAQNDYQNKDYYRAFTEAMKRYITATRTKSSSANATDNGMMGEVYGKGKILSVAKKFKKPNGTDFTQSTIENIEEGQKFLSMGILSGGRNPVSHEEISDLRDSGLFSEKDCLDFLSLLSHLYKRLNDSEKP